jgi:excisionase family DNA binding protein
MSSSAATGVQESVRRMTPVAAPDDQRERVAAMHELMKHAPRSRPEAVSYKLVSPTGDVTEVPESVVSLLERIIEVLARGDAITVVPVGKELTTQQAANILNVSRQYVVRLLDEGRIPYRRTGTHRRIRVQDLLSYKGHRDRDRKTALDDLSRLTQEYGGYDELSRND